jgi:hypothetical protein
MTLTYLRLAIVVLGLADGLLFRHATGAITALITIGALDIVKLGGPSCDGAGAGRYWLALCYACEA